MSLLFIPVVLISATAIIGLRIYVGKKIPELKGITWTLDDLKANKKVYSIVKNVIYILLFFLFFGIVINFFNF